MSTQSAAGAGFWRSRQTPDRRSGDAWCPEITTAVADLPRRSVRLAPQRRTLGDPAPCAASTMPQQRDPVSGPGYQQTQDWQMRRGGFNSAQDGNVHSLLGGDSRAPAARPWPKPAVPDRRDPGKKYMPIGTACPSKVIRRSTSARGANAFGSRPLVGSGPGAAVDLVSCACSYGKRCTAVRAQRQDCRDPRGFRRDAGGDRGAAAAAPWLDRCGRALTAA